MLVDLRGSAISFCCKVCDKNEMIAMHHCSPKNYTPWNTISEFTTSQKLIWLHEAIDIHNADSKCIVKISLTKYVQSWSELTWNQ